ncbi:MAG: hypothetical protein H6728_11810 [Myxococcales bacterium]|nr:hypothetical protein [Myxococcales bacterium]
MPGVMLGGETGVGIGIWGWRLTLLGRVEGWVYGEDDLRLVSIQPSLLLGLPFLRWGGRFGLTLDLGAGVDVLWVSKEQGGDSWRYRVGGMAHILFLWAWSPRVTNFARLSFFISDQSYNFQQGSEISLDIPIWRLCLHLGFRFFAL